jgi:hypothetical protein
MPRIAVAAIALLAVLASPAAAETVTIGSPLQQTPNLPFGCEARPYPGVNGMQLLATGVSSCTWWSAPLTAANTYVPRGAGRVTSARVLSGPNPAPLRITILSSGSGLCCTAQAVSGVFQPTPNAVTQVPLDLPAGSGLDPNRQGGQYNDIVTVSAVGPGSLPVHDFGVHGTFDTSAPAASFLHPELVPNNSNTDVGWMDGYEVLMQFTWCGTPGVGRAAQLRQAPAGCPGAAAAPVATPGAAVAAPTPAPLGAASSTARVRKGLAALRLRCATATTCRGRITLRPRGGRRTLGRAAFTVGAGSTRTIRVHLTKAGRRLARPGRRVAVDAVVTLKDGRRLTLAITLRR